MEVNQIRLYGVNSSKYEYVKTMLAKILDKAAISYSLEEIKDVDRFISDGIESIPAIKVNQHVFIQAGEYKDIHHFVKEAGRMILKDQNFGQMKKIIVPTDFSPSADVAFQYAQKLAQELGAVIKLVHAYHPSPVDQNGIVYVDHELEKYKRLQLNQFVKAFNQDWLGDVITSPLVDGEFVIGFPVQTLIEYSKEVDTTLIVMGTKGESAAGLRKLFGSVSSDVAQRAHCPVLLIPPKVNYSPIRNIIYATNEPELDSKILDLTVDFSAHFDACIHLVHVDQKEGSKIGNDLIELWQEKYPSQKIRNTVIPSESLWSGLETYAKTNEIDLIVMATKHRNFWQRFIHARMVKEMALNTHFPLLVLHNKDKI